MNGLIEAAMRSAGHASDLRFTQFSISQTRRFLLRDTRTLLHEVPLKLP